ncbi:MAG: protein kinase [Deltaproteobacteria bacterium]|jgi:tRNA A-37 threonylcarbamoyl transferase component Bud32|nr:protein kinase [Deltaproteobacteria bacterium]
MGIQQRAAAAAILCAVGSFPISASAAETSGRALDWSIEASEIEALHQRYVEPYIEPIVAPWREALTHSAAFRELQQFATSETGLSALGALVVLLVTLLFVLRHRRATGQIALRLEFPESIDGDFEIALHRKSSKRAEARANARPNPTARRPRSRMTRSGVHRETQFDRLGPGLWFVTIEGQLSARGSGAPLAKISEEIDVRLSTGEWASVELVLPAVEAPIELRIQWDHQRARDVGVALRGRPHSLRYASQGVAKTSLPLGRHTILIGAGDRVVEREVVVEDYDPRILSVDLATSEGLVFKGCPPAVSAFLQGDIGGAARALERDGQSEAAHGLLAELHKEQGQIERAAEQLENAGRLAEAAELRRSISDFARAAALYEGSGEARKAAEMYDKAEAWSEAARAYSNLEDWANAARCYECAGDVERLIDALEAQGALIRAAELASERDDRARAIRLLHKIVPGSPDYDQANALLVSAFEQEGHLDLAARELDRRLEALSEAERPPELELKLAELLTQSGDLARALGVLEGLRERDPTFPNVASRIEGLRKKLSSPSLNMSTAGFTPPHGATAFVARQRYEILEEIGRGGMGLVYRARDRRLGRDVALKRMPDNLREHPTAVSLFLREAQAAARMNHPNIVTLYDADQDNGHFFITMELLDGLPLNQILELRGRFGPRDTARIGRQVCAGLGYAHDQGIVHRDIKTANLFITREKTVKIMDFGLAKIVEAVRDDGASVIAGTPYYMPPEQAAGGRVDGRTDLYALGVTLFELATGELPFSEGNVGEQHRSTPAPDPRDRIKGLPASLVRTLLAMLAKSPDDRPSSAAAVAAALDRVIREA